MREREGKKERRGERGREGGGAQGRDGLLCSLTLDPFSFAPSLHRPTRPTTRSAACAHLARSALTLCSRPPLACTYRVRSDLPGGAGNNVPGYRRPAPRPEAFNGDLERHVLSSRPPPRDPVVYQTDLVGRVQQYRQTRGDPGVGHGQGSRPLSARRARRLSCPLAAESVRDHGAGPSAGVRDVLGSRTDALRPQ